MPVPMISVRGLGSVVEADRRWALDERGARTSREICILKIIFKDVSREFDEFQVNCHLCKLRCWYS